MNMDISYKDVDVLLDSLALLKSTIEHRKRTYEPIDLDEIDCLVKKIISLNNATINVKKSN